MTFPLTGRTEQAVGPITLDGDISAEEAAVRKDLAFLIQVFLKVNFCLIANECLSSPHL